MSRHASFLLGQALEALTEITVAADLETAVTIASAALAGIMPSAADWPGVERGARSSLIGDGAATPPAESPGAPTPAAVVSATGTPTPEAVPSPVLRALVDSPMCGNPSGGYVCVRDAHPRRPNDHVYIRPQQMEGGESDGLLGLVIKPGFLAGGKEFPSASPQPATMTGGNS